MPTPEARRARRRAVILVAVFALAGIGASTITYLVSRGETDTKVRQVATEAAVTNCREQVKGRSVLRKVIVGAFEDGNSVFELPPDPDVPAAVIAYLQRLVDQISMADRSATRERLLAEAPPLRCTNTGQVVSLETEGGN